MSGLEPLAALGLACNVLQVLSFAGEVCKHSKSFFEQGQAPETATAFTKASESLTKAFNEAENIATTSPRPLTQHDEELRRIAEKCKNAAKDLRDEVENATRAAKAKGKRVNSVIIGFQSVTRKKKVEDLERLLKMHQKQLDTRLLVNIWCVPRPPTAGCLTADRLGIQ